MFGREVRIFKVRSSPRRSEGLAGGPYPGWYGAQYMAGKVRRFEAQIRLSLFLFEAYGKLRQALIRGYNLYRLIARIMSSARSTRNEGLQPATRSRK
jgi:hypothetical protein